MRDSDWTCPVGRSGRLVGIAEQRESVEDLLQVDDLSWDELSDGEGDDIDRSVDVVALTIAEFIPRQVIHLQQILDGFPLLGDTNEPS